MMHNMMLHRSLRICRVPEGARVAVSNRRTELRHEGIRACRIRIALLAILVVVAGQGCAAEAEKDCNGDYAERFHC